MKFYDYRKWAWEQNITPSNRKFVLICISEFSDEKGSCYPKIETISEMVNQGVSTVRDHIKGLVEDGYLKRIRLRHTDGSYAQYRYFIQCQNSAVDDSTTASFAPSPPPALPHHHRQLSADNNNQLTIIEQPIPPNPQGNKDWERAFDKLWTHILNITHKSIKSRHNKKTARARFKKLVTRKVNPIKPGKLMNALMWFYDQDQQKKDNNKFMSGLQVVLNNEGFDHYLDEKPFRTLLTAADKADDAEAQLLAKWTLWAGVINSGGDWGGYWGQESLCPKRFRKLFDRKHWKKLGWEKS